MKKIGWGLCLLSFLLGSGVYATSTTQVAEASVTVASVFEMSLDRTDIDFGNMSPGDVKYDVPATGIRVTTKSNSGQKWYLKVSADDDLRSGARVIDNQHFFWYGWTEGQGRWLGTGDDRFSMLPVTAYESTTTEGLNIPDGTSNVFRFKLEMPKNQLAGRYETLVKFTLTE